MPKLHDTTDTEGLVSDLLFAHYGKTADPRALDALVEALHEEDAEEVLAAVRAHLNDTTPCGRHGEPLGDFAPSLANVQRHLETARRRRVEQAGNRQDDADDERQDPQRWTDVPVDAPLQRTYHLPPTIRLRRSDCHHCGDTGLARFWYDPQNARRVWTQPQYLTLATTTAAALRVSTCLCTCPAGQRRPERDLTTVLPYHGRERVLPTYPRLERIVQLAEQRRAQEHPVTAGAAPDELAL